MPILAAIKRVPGGLMVVPLMLGAALNTLDQAHLGWIQALLKWLGQQPLRRNGVDVYEFFQIGGFFSALFKTSAMPLIALFLFVVGSQMNLRIGGRALKKGVILTSSKFALGVGIGALLGLHDPGASVLGLSAVAIIAGMTNENGGMYAALTGQFGNKSDSGALAVLSINDGPFLTLLGLGLLGLSFPAVVFIGVLVPILLGMLLGNLDRAIRDFLAPAESILIPFFAFSLGAGMDFGDFLKPVALAGGLILGIATVVLVPLIGALALRLCGERSTLSAVCGGSVAGNAVQTPAAVAAAAVLAGRSSPEVFTPAVVQGFQDGVNLANAQLTVAVLTTAVLCPLATAWFARWQLSRGIDGRREPGIRDGDETLAATDVHLG